MGTVRLSGVRIAGVTCAVPGSTVSDQGFEGAFTAADIAAVAKMTGVRERRIADDSTCTSDLCTVAGEALLSDLGWPQDSVDALIFVTQTPDYALPASACLLQERLGLAHSCAAFDVNLGCSGYVYGLWLASSLIGSGSCQRVLLLVGDTITKVASPRDRATALLFGDAGSATALEGAAAAADSFYVLGTDGSGAYNLMIPAGGCRERVSPEACSRTQQADGSWRSRSDLYMNGGEIFNFTIKTVPGMVGQALAAAGESMDGVDYVLFHQANEFMLKHLAKKLKLPPDKVPFSIGSFGNTSSASIPLTMVTAIGQGLRAQAQRLVMAGFGVGYSWGAALLTVGPLASARLVEVQPRAATGE